MLTKLITLYNQQHTFIWLVLAVCSIWLISRCLVPFTLNSKPTSLFLLLASQQAKKDKTVRLPLAEQKLGRCDNGTTVVALGCLVVGCKQPHCTINRHPTVPFTLNSKPTSLFSCWLEPASKREPVRLSLAERHGGTISMVPEQKEREFSGTPVPGQGRSGSARPLHWDRIPVSTVEGFKGGSGAGKPIYVTRATKPEDISRGLMFRTEPLGQNEGLLFDKGSWSDTGFWMKNTLIPLDIIFLDEEYQVIDVLRDMVPGDLTVRSINKSWRYAVEVNAGGYPDINIGAGVNIIG
jgi:uncharacterized membrane protein (UPF0127 family)